MASFLAEPLKMGTSRFALAGKLRGLLGLVNLLFQNCDELENGGLAHVALFEEGRHCGVRNWIPGMGAVPLQA